MDVKIKESWKKKTHTNNGQSVHQFSTKLLKSEI